MKSKGHTIALETRCYILLLGIQFAQIVPKANFVKMPCEITHNISQLLSHTVLHTL